MSRIRYNDDYDELAELRWGAWEHNTKLAFEGKRGQAALRELEAALLALPEPKLAADQFCVVRPHLGVPGLPIVEACALGALAWHKGVADRVPDDFNPVLMYDPLDGWGWEGTGDAGAEEQAKWAADHLRMTYTLAWNIIEENDEFLGRMSPEARYQAMLRWVREHIRR